MPRGLERPKAGAAPHAGGERASRQRRPSRVESAGQRKIEPPDQASGPCSYVVAEPPAAAALLRSSSCGPPRLLAALPRRAAALSTTERRARAPVRRGVRAHEPSAPSMARVASRRVRRRREGCTAPVDGVDGGGSVVRPMHNRLIVVPHDARLPRAHVRERKQSRRA